MSCDDQPHEPPAPVMGQSVPRQDGAANTNSQVLMERARGGSQSALGELLEGCRDYLLLVANEEVPSDIRQKVAASDLVQETLAEACEGFHRFHGGHADDLLAWMRRMLLNNVVDATREFRDTAKRNVAREMSLQADESKEQLLQQLVADQSSPSQHVEKAEQHARLLAALERLPAHYRDVIQRRNLGSQSFVEIGREMNLSADSARKLWDRAIEFLADELASSDDTP